MSACRRFFFRCLIRVLVWWYTVQHFVVKSNRVRLGQDPDVNSKECHWISRYHSNVMSEKYIWFACAPSKMLEQESKWKLTQRNISRGGCHYKGLWSWTFEPHDYFFCSPQNPKVARSKRLTKPEIMSFDKILDITRRCSFFFYDTCEVVELHLVLSVVRTQVSWCTWPDKLMGDDNSRRSLIFIHIIHVPWLLELESSLIDLQSANTPLSVFPALWRLLIEDLWKGRGNKKQPLTV